GGAPRRGRRPRPDRRRVDAPLGERRGEAGKARVRHRRAPQSALGAVDRGLCGALIVFSPRTEEALLSSTASSRTNRTMARGTDAEVEQGGFITDFPDGTDSTDCSVRAHDSTPNEPGRSFFVKNLGN